MKILITAYLLFLSSSVFAGIFPNEKTLFKYDVIFSPVNDPTEVLKGEMTLELYDVKKVESRTVFSFRQSSSIFPRFKYFEAAESRDGLWLKNITFLGVGSDSIQAEYPLLTFPLRFGRLARSRVLESKLVAMDEVYFYGELHTAYRISVIGSWENYYTIVGNYWIVPNLGIVQAKYVTDGWDVTLRLRSAHLIQ